MRIRKFTSLFVFTIFNDINNIQIIHLHGGELTLSAQDDAFRHSISKLSVLHFPTMNIYKKRLIQLGENPKTIFNFGSLNLLSLFNLL